MVAAGSEAELGLAQGAAHHARRVGGIIFGQGLTVTTQVHLDHGKTSCEGWER
jgi:hypothetical protein